MIGIYSKRIGELVKQLNINDEVGEKYKIHLENSCVTLINACAHEGLIPVLSILQCACRCGGTHICSDTNVIKNKTQVLGFLKEIIKDIEEELKNVN